MDSLVYSNKQPGQQQHPKSEQQQQPAEFFTKMRRSGTWMYENWPHNTAMIVASRPYHQAKLGTIHKKYYNSHECLVSNSAPKETQENHTLKPSEVPDNVVNLAAYIEAQCPDTSRFVHRQLLPTWQELSVTNRISIKIVPFGKAKCDPIGNDYSCECQHGPSECELNQLMNCVIEMVKNPHLYVPVISCIQGKRDLRSAGLKCLSKLLVPNKSILRCAEGEEGRRLLAKAGVETGRLQPPLNFVPWIMINGTRSSDAFYDLKKNLCDALDPVPDQCKEEQK